MSRCVYPIILGWMLHELGLVGIGHPRTFQVAIMSGPGGLLNELKPTIFEARRSTWQDDVDPSLSYERFRVKSRKVDFHSSFFRFLW
jgi:hypothetical protein